MFAGKSAKEEVVNLKCARALNAMNTRFYAEVHASFSQTRAAAWPGWERLLCETALSTGEQGVRVLDVACGNLRFERFAHEAMDGMCSFVAVDVCDELAERSKLAESGIFVDYVHDDLVESILCGRGLRGELAEGAREGFGLAVSFGFMHHIPGHENRVRFLRGLLECVRPGGYVAVSLWRFMASARLAEKAALARPAALAYLAQLGGDSSELEPGDHFLGWQEAEAWRYCHHFSEDEVSCLAEAVRDRADVRARYLADGKTNDLNCYLVLQRR